MSGNLWQNKKGRTGKHRTKKIHDCIITSFFFLSEHNQQSWESCTGKFAFGNGRSYTFLDRIRKRVEQRVLVFFLFRFATNHARRFSIFCSRPRGVLQNNKQFKELCTGMEEGCFRRKRKILGSLAIPSQFREKKKYLNLIPSHMCSTKRSE